MKMVNATFGRHLRAQYLASNQGPLRDQAKVFYGSLITGVDPDATTRFTFAG